MDKEQLPDFLEARSSAARKRRRPTRRRWSGCSSASSGPLPRQKMPLWRLPGVLLDWQFAPAWPRFAALACFAALGFVIGIAGIDRRFDGGGAPFAVASAPISARSCSSRKR